MSNSRTFVPTMWGGRGDDVDANGNTIAGTNGAQRDIDRYRAMAGDTPTSGPQIDHSVSDESRGMSMGALGLLGQTAAGTAPSAAERLGQQQTQQAQNAQFSLGASVRGGAAARAAGNQNAIFGANTAGLVGQQQQQATRAGEMAAARDAYMNASTAQRGMDLGAATSQSQLDQAQRSQNEQHDQFYEGLGFGVQQSQTASELGRSAADEAATNAARTTALNEQAQERQQNQAMLSTITGGVTGGAAAYNQYQQSQTPDPNDPTKTGSDGRMKFNVRNVTTSDERAKAAAWDEGRAAALANIAHDVKKSPEELRNAAGPESRAVRAIKEDAYDEGHADGHAAGRGTLLRDQHAAAGRSMDAANAERAANRKAPEPFDDSLSRYNPVEGIRGILHEYGSPSPAKPQQRGAPIMRAPAPSGDFDSQVRDQFGAPPPAATAPPQDVTPGFISQLAPQTRTMTTSDKNAKYTDYGDDGGAMAAANRSMAPKSYSYKPGFAEREGQTVGETNVGPIAQSMKRDPVASTVIVEDPRSGLLSIDKDKGLKLTMGGLASLQKQVDDLKRKR